MRGKVIHAVSSVSVYNGYTVSDASVRGVHLIAGASVVYCDGKSVRVWIEWMCV